jgi:MFS family permease
VNPLGLDVEPSALSHRRQLPLYALYAANLVSYVGDMMMFLAVPWFVLQTTGSVVQTGITGFFTTGSIVVAALLGSVVVDRLGFKPTSVVSDLASCIAVGLIPLLYKVAGLPFWALLLLVFCAGLLTTPGATARAALVPDLAALASVRMEKATALTDGISRLARFIGAPLAGVLIAVIGTNNLLWIDATTFATSALLIGLLVPRRLPVAEHELARSRLAVATPSGTPAAAPARRRLFANARDGIGFIVRDPVLAGTLLVVLITNMLDSGYGAVLAPAWVKQIYDSSVALGSLIAAFSGAAFLGAITFGAIGHRLPRRLTLGWGFTIGGAVRLFFVVLLAHSLPALVVTQALCGFCIGPINPLFSTIEFERVPAEKRARVFGAGTAGSMLATPLGALVAGGLAAALGIWPCILIFGVVYTLATASLLVNPALRQIDSGAAAPKAKSIA